MIATEKAVRMKAIVCDRPGPAGDLALREIDRPDVAEGSVLVRVHASSANPVDLFPTSMVGYLMGGRKPVVLGTDFAGTVEAVGAGVTEFHEGDEVFGGGPGAFAEYKMIAAAGAVAPKPAGVSFSHAGTVAVAASTALQALRDHGHVEPGQKVLINGASGGVGTFAVQIAKALGAEVTAVCSARNVEMVRSLGADRVIDYSTEDFTAGADKYDLMIDIAASHTWPQLMGVIAPDGMLVGTGAAAIQHGKGGSWRALGLFASRGMRNLARRRRAVPLFITKLNRADLELLGELMASGHVTPVIERTYPLEEAPQALSYLNAGHVRAKLAIEVG